MQRLRVEAQCQRLDQVLDFVNAQLEPWDCPMKIMPLIGVCVEEIFVNIAHYAYPQGGGWAEIYCQAGPGRVEIRLEDEGVAFDPLSRTDPDVTLDAQARQIGGLGIFMVKRSMDQVSYCRQEGRNKLTMVKRW